MPSGDLERIAQPPRGADAQAKIAAGVQLVQVYSGLIYRGPVLVKECAAALRS